MFKSKMRPIVIPQYEHGRLTGTLASQWGNADFDRPAIDFAAFVRGVALHDWHYGILDNLPITEGSEADWLALTEKGVEYWFDDPTTDIVAKLHLKRLLSGRNTPETEALINRIEVRITERLPQTGYSRRQFDWADKITRFCDQLAFDFSFEAPTKNVYPVYAKANAPEETPLHYSIKPGGHVEIDPWPFSVDSLSGVLIGYQRAGFPETLTPEVIPFKVGKRA